MRKPKSALFSGAIEPIRSHGRNGLGPTPPVSRWQRPRWYPRRAVGQHRRARQISVILPRGIGRRLIVPGLEAPAQQRIMNQEAAPLAVDDLPADRLAVPLARNLLGERGLDCRMLGPAREIVQLERVGREIEQLRRIAGAADV